MKITPPKPFVLAPIGIPGSGKTTLVNWLEERINARIVSRDTIRIAMFQPCTFTAEEKLAAFEAVIIATKTNLLLGKSVLTDGMCFSEPGVFERVQQISMEMNARCIPVYCDCPLATAIQRVNHDLAEKNILRSIEIQISCDMLREVSGSYLRRFFRLTARKPLTKLVLLSSNT